jgi:hypothetical protein
MMIDYVERLHVGLCNSTTCQDTKLALSLTTLCDVVLTICWRLPLIAILE